MAFRTDGSPHKNGIEIEHQIVDFINESYLKGNDVLNIYNDLSTKLDSIGCVVCTHLGGTGNKADALVKCCNLAKTKTVTYTVSIKRKKYENGKPKGTFDVINTTLAKFNEEYKIFDNNNISSVENWLESKKPVIKTDEDIDSIRDDFADLCSELLEKTVNDADKFISLTRREFIKTDLFVVGKTIEKNGKEELVEVFTAHEKDIKLFDEEGMQDNKYSLSQGRGKSSRTLMVTNKKVQNKKTPFRVRLVLNNGLSAFYGLSNANNTSILAIKIQVDGVKYIVEQMSSYKID